MNLSLFHEAAERDYSGCTLTKSVWANRQKFGTSLALFLLICLSTRRISGSESEPPPSCDSKIYCQGDLLHTVQMAHLFPDSKTFVDMKLKHPPNQTLYEFNAFMEKTNHTPTVLDLERFVSEHFDPAGSELEEYTPKDWVEKPEFLNRIKDRNYRKWAYELNLLWKVLGKKMKEDVKEHPEYYSIVYVPNAVIVPGGRFREFYYWDSYWIIKGLLLSEMDVTVKGMLENFLTIIDRFGFIPNGGRVYYSMRSQPPTFIPMVQSYLEKKDDVEFLKKSLPILEKEFNYWMTNHSVLVNKDGVNYTLYRYVQTSKGPRPESYREDYISARFFKTDNEKQEFYTELKAAAESGWDFSSRWFIQNGTNKGNLTHLKTKYIVPVDLNALLYWNADILSKLFTKVGDEQKSLLYAKKASEILEAVNKVLWLDQVGIWLDYDLLNEKERDYFYPSNFAPLWTGCYDKDQKDYIVGKVLKYVQQRGIMPNYLGGVPTTLYLTNEQWDLPNAWPPLQHIMVMGLYQTGDAYAMELAYEIANRWVKSNYVAYNETGHMYEKYDATSVGGHGTGGEYDVQLGFGWSNGVVLDFLNLFGDRLSSVENEFEPSLLMKNPEQFHEVPDNLASAASGGLITPLILTVVIFLGMFFGGSIW
ncbi:UNVERIFIED_CONTAM: hypothetical protein PYX00_008531 [Menopon gallinae]